MQLHTFFRSSASYRVRIALKLKGIAYDAVAVHLSRNGGEQFSAAFDALNPQHLLPVLVDNDLVLNQSLAIIEYLDETHPGTPLLPVSAAARARVRALSQMIACDVHPLNNLRVLNYLSQQFALDSAQKDAWYRHWLGAGLAPFEAALADSPATGRFCHGGSPGMADWCHRCSMHSVSIATCRRIPRSCAFTRLAWSLMHSRPPVPRASSMRCKWARRHPAIFRLGGNCMYVGAVATSPFQRIVKPEDREVGRLLALDQD
jgi:maleylacetoacetate isomerase